VNPLRLTVIGTAEPKGSAKIVPLRRKFPITIHSFRELLTSVAVTSDNAAVKGWEKQIARAARFALGDQMAGAKGAFVVTLRVFLPPPKKIPADRGGLPIGRQSGDVDKFSRAALDALTSVAYEDDAMVVDLVVSKRYAATPAEARLEITVTPIAIGLPFPEPEITHGHSTERSESVVPW
jgi:Holliday junction resolvase RusA-like endonuclease